MELIRVPSLAVILWSISLSAAPPLLERLKDEAARGQDQWIYNDLAKARAEARRTGKPIFVTFRCVPCSACKAFDAEVAKGSKAIGELAKKHFISLRQVEMKGVDLSQFQFDYDLNWAAMFINADGTVYGRYGTQSADGPDAYNSVESLEKTMRRVISVHANYATYKKYLTNKRGKPKPYKTALEMPGLEPERKKKFQGLTERNNCIHCHNVHDAENNQLQLSGKWSKEMLWRYPLPDNIGLEIDPKDGLKISKVIPNSPAAKAGLMAGQSISYINNQLVLSIADIQWVLHNLPNAAATINVYTWNSNRNYTLTTRAGWKKTDVSWRGSMWDLRPRLRVYMPKAKPQELKKLNLPEGQHALRVQWININSPEGRAAKKAGLREGDFIVALGGKSFDEAISHRAFNTLVKLNYKSGEKLALSLLRKGKRIALELPLQ